MAVSELITTQGATDANSYASVAEADAYFNDLYGAGDWATATADDKKRLLLLATKMVDKLNVTYRKADDAQRLKFPIKNNYGNIEGFPEAKEATIIQAYYLLRNFESIQSTSDEAIQNISGQTLGKVQITKTAPGINPYRKYDSEVYQLLKKWIDLTVGLSRG
jgi:hypothetical protein